MIEIFTVVACLSLAAVFMFMENPWWLFSIPLLGTVIWMTSEIWRR